MAGPDFEKPQSTTPEPTRGSAGQRPDWATALADRAFRAVINGTPMAEGEIGPDEALANRVFREQIVLDITRREGSIGGEY
jgi:hypothetical protein